MKNTFAFIGAGNMGGAIIEAVCRAVEPKNVFVFDRDRVKTDMLSEKNRLLRGFECGGGG